MGIGDELMAAAQARAASRKHKCPARILDRKGQPRWHWIWRDNCFVARPDQNGRTTHIINGPGCRPYVDYERTTKERWVYTAWSVQSVGPGNLPSVKRLDRQGYVVVEPHIKANASPNKQWGWSNWQALVDLSPDLDWVQLGPRGTATLEGVRLIATDNFLTAAHMLSGARAAVLPEGGLHHAAATVGTPAVVLFGGMLSPRNTGYREHVNIAVDDPEALGWRVRHSACERAWQEITPQMVVEEMRRLL